jgi:hypothetical protein
MPLFKKSKSFIRRAKMKGLILLLIFSYIACWVGISSAVDINAQTGFHYDWWDDTKDNNAWQSNVPLRFEVRQQDFSLAVLTGYANTNLNPSHGGSRSLSHILDTKINLSYEILDKLPVDVLIGLDFNLPSGKTDLNKKELSLIMDPDLISINNFGEGFNINPTLTIAKEWGNWVAGLGIGYLWRGKYNYGFIEQTQDHSIQIVNYDPGDILNLNAEIRYDFSPNWYARFFGNYAHFEKEDWDQKDTFITPAAVSELKAGNSFREGDFFLFGVGLHYNQAKWDSGFTLRSIFRSKSKFQDEDGRLSTEDRNIHGDEWVGDLSFRYFLNNKTILKSLLQGLLITKNDYNSSSDPDHRFIGQREKLSLELGASRMLSPHIEGSLTVKGFLMHDEEVRFPAFLSERDYQGFSAGILLTSRF